MYSSKTLGNTSQTNKNNLNKAIAMKSQNYYSSRRTPSFSSTSSSISSNNDYIIDSASPFSTPTSTPARFSGGVPFSWEHFPGIPKKQLSNKKPINDQYPTPKTPITTTKLFPLMPPPKVSPEDYKSVIRVTTTNPNSNNNYYTKHQNKYFENDPFFAALVECSKDDRLDDRRKEISIDHSNMNRARFWSLVTAKVSRSLSDRLGFVGVYSSCKRTCSVDESIRHLPRSTRSPYDLINNRSR